MAERNSEGRLVKAKDFFASPDGIPSAAIRKFHYQILDKATVALQVQSLDQRSFSANIFNLDKTRVKQAKARLVRFRRKFMKDFGSEANENVEVFCFSQQLFSLMSSRKPYP
jgi:hypothetical protein